VQPGDSVAIQWNEAFLQGVRDSKLGPPMVARALAIGHTCIYDAWAAYDHRSGPRRVRKLVRLGSVGANGGWERAWAPACDRRWGRRR
jgi:hypothetical protein